MIGYKVFLVEDNVLKSMSYNTLEKICDDFPTTYKVGMWTPLNVDFPFFCLYPQTISTVFIVSIRELP